MTAGAHQAAGSLLLALLVLAAPANAQTTNRTTASPTTTPTPDAGAQTLASLLAGLSAGGASSLVISYKINGLVYIVQCNVTSSNTTNCTYTGDHGLTVTAVVSTGLTDIPWFYLMFGIVTVVLLVVLMIMASCAYWIWNKRYNQEMAERTAQEKAAAERKNCGGGGYGYEPVPPPYQDPRAMAGKLSSHKVINVALVRPCQPEEAA